MLKMFGFDEHIALCISFKSSDYEYIFPESLLNNLDVQMAGLAIGEDFKNDIEDSDEKLDSKLLFYKDNTDKQFSKGLVFSHENNIYTTGKTKDQQNEKKDKLDYFFTEKELKGWNYMEMNY